MSKINIHGGDIYSYHKPIIDFSANINPLGLPKVVAEEIINSISDCSNYPDIFCRDLTNSLSQCYSLSQDKIICGNGAAELIYKIALAFKPKKALLLAPTFAEYEFAMQTVSCTTTDRKSVV